MAIRDYAKGSCGTSLLFRPRAMGFPSISLKFVVNSYHQVESKTLKWNDFQEVRVQSTPPVPISSFVPRFSSELGDEIHGNCEFWQTLSAFRTLSRFSDQWETLWDGENRRLDPNQCSLYTGCGLVRLFFIDGNQLLGARSFREGAQRGNGRCISLFSVWSVWRGSELMGGLMVRDEEERDQGLMGSVIDRDWGPTHFLLNFEDRGWIITLKLQILPRGEHGRLLLLMDDLRHSSNGSLHVRQLVHRSSKITVPIIFQKVFFQFFLLSSIPTRAS